MQTITCFEIYFEVFHWNCFLIFCVLNPVNREPGIFFEYDISPILAPTYLDREPPLHLVTRLLTVLVGALGLFRLFDTTIYMSKKKNDPEYFADK